jgi:hypothetical protein
MEFSVSKTVNKLLFLLNNQHMIICGFVFEKQGVIAMFL